MAHFSKTSLFVSPLSIKYIVFKAAIIIIIIHTNFQINLIIVVMTAMVVEHKSYMLQNMAYVIKV